MTNTAFWRELESGDSPLTRIVRWLVIGGGILTLAFTGALELTWPQQCVLGLLMVLLAIWLDRSSTSYVITLTLMLASMFSTFRYGYWRLHTVINFFQ